MGILKSAGSFLQGYNPKVIKSRWNAVRGSPYASLKFQYMITKGIVIALILFIVWTLSRLIISYDGGSSTMTIVGRAITLFIMVLVCWKAWGTLDPLKRALSHYEKNPTTVGNTQQIDVEREVDDILNRFENRKKKGAK